MKNKKRTIKILIISVVFLLAAGVMAAFFDWHNNYYDRICPGVKIGNLNLAGKTAAEAREVIGEKTEAITKAGLTFRTENKNTTIGMEVSAFDSDLSYPALIFDADETARQASALGIPKNFLHYLFFRLEPRAAKIIKPTYTLDESRMKELLSENFKDLEIPAENAFFSVSKSGKIQANPEKIGKEINYSLVLSEIRAVLDDLDNRPIEVKTHSKYPEVKQTDLEGLSAEAGTVIGEGGLDLIFSEDGAGTSTAKTWHIKPDKLVTWLSVAKGKNEPIISLDSEKIKQYLSLNASPEIDLEAVRPRFEIHNGRVANWQAGTSGRQVDIEASAANIIDQFAKGERRIPLIVKEVAGSTPDTGQNLEIKEIIGTGQSDFTGSSANRKNNIRVGANAVHGILVAPGEEFSLVKVLGDVSAETGYSPELVIKGNKTTPEYGGGLCQIATTVFRAALASGLPITERRNHSYRVSYYEPAGTDAAVYLPKPDVRFINDTPNYILIQARIVKNLIYFDFWGTKDGRIATTTTPVIYNVTKPAPTKYVESDDLPAGQKKCTEKAHNGADTYFDYKVTYPTGATSTPTKEVRFSSHYVPWQEVCLIGRQKATSTPPATASSTPAKIDTKTDSSNAGTGNIGSGAAATATTSTGI